MQGCFIEQWKFLEKSTKTILFNTKGPLPSGVEDKLNASGLTDELTNESSEKTLYYKTTLYLKSLPPKDEGDDVLYDGNSDYDPAKIIEKNKKAKSLTRDKVCYISKVEKITDEEVEVISQASIDDLLYSLNAA